MKRIEQLIRNLPDPDAAKRFLGQLAENHPKQSAKLLKNEGLLSDVLTLVSFSPLLATTVLQNPDYFWWLGRKRLNPVFEVKKNWSNRSPALLSQTRSSSRRFCSHVSAGVSFCGYIFA